MSDEFEVIARLHALADQPVDEALAARHADLLGAQPPWSATAGKARWRTMVAGGTIAAAVFAGTGIAAAAGNLPTPAQNAAHSVLSKVGVDVPKGTARSTEGCDGKTYANHGQFVRSQPKGAARDAAAQSKCGKPVQAGQDGTKPDDQNETDDNGTDTGKGKATAPGQQGDKGKPTATTPTTPGDKGKSTAPGLSKKGK